LARDLRDTNGVFQSATRLLILFLHGVDAFEERVRLAEEVIELPRDGVSARFLGPACSTAGHVFLATGDRHRAEQCWQAMADIADRTQDGSVLLIPVQEAIAVATMDGDMDGALVALARLVEQEQALSMAAASQETVFAARLCAYLARDDLAETVVSRPGLRPDKALCLAHVGRHAEAQGILDQAFRGPRPFEENRIDRLTVWLETSVLVGDREVAARILPRLTPAAPWLIGDYYDHTCVARHLGAAAAFLDDGEAAKRFTEQAIELAARIRHRPELALSHLQLAELLLDGTADEQAAAAEHLNFAIDEFRAMKMQPSLERALGHKGLLKA